MIDSDIRTETLLKLADLMSHINKTMTDLNKEVEAMMQDIMRDLREDEPQIEYCDTCRFEDYSSSKEPCNSCLIGGSKWQPKDEPQTDCPWR